MKRLVTAFISEVVCSETVALGAIKRNRHPRNGRVSLLSPVGFRALLTCKTECTVKVTARM